MGEGHSELQSEVVALQAVLIALLRRLMRDRPELRPSVCDAFEEAEAILTGVAEKMGLDAPLGSTVGALAVVEEIRAAVIRDERACAPQDSGSPLSG
jgi:hypothetical protein